MFVSKHKVPKVDRPCPHGKTRTDGRNNDVIGPGGANRGMWESSSVALRDWKIWPGPGKITGPLEAAGDKWARDSMGRSRH